MAVEAKRKCGYRKVGGIYLVSSGAGWSCDRLPFDLTPCPTCGGGFKPSRSFTWIPNPRELFCFFFGVGEWDTPEDSHNCTCPPDCPVCDPREEPAVLLWLGESYYTPSEWIAEATEQGISRRIAYVPKNLNLGVTWVFVAWRGKKETQDQGERPPAIFHAFMPERVEIIITDQMAKKPELMKRLTDRGLTPVIVPGNDADHNPDGYSDYQIELDLNKKIGTKGADSRLGAEE